MIKINHKVACIAVAVFAALMMGYIFIQRGYFLNPSYLSGDEPHYVMMADNLLHYGNFNLELSYKDKLSQNYYVGDLDPHISPASDKESGAWYSIHTIGLPILITIPYALAGVLGARIFMILVQLMFIPVFFLILKKYIKNSKRCWFGIFALLLCPLYWQNVGAIMPDLILLTMTGVAVLLFDKKDVVSNIILVILTLLTYYIHTKGLLLIGPILLFKYIRDIYSSGFLSWLKKSWPYLAILIIGMCGYSLYLLMCYGSISPTSLYGSNGQLFSANPLCNFVAALTDRSKGILIYFPLLVLFPVYFIRWLKLDFKKIFMNFKKNLTKKHANLKGTYFLGAGVLVGVIIFLITQLGFTDWSGSTAPNARYALVFLVCAIFVMTKYINIQNRLEVFIYALFLMFDAVIMLICNSKIIYYISVGVNSFLVEKFTFLMHFPLFSDNAAQGGSASMVRGLLILGAIILFNVALYYIYSNVYVVKLGKRNVNKELRQ